MPQTDDQPSDEPTRETPHEHQELRLAIERAAQTIRELAERIADTHSTSDRTAKSSPSTVTAA
jgi:hypothetical protein